MSKYIKLDSANDAIVTVLEHTDCRDAHIDSVLRRIESLPTIEVSDKADRPRGEWSLTLDDDYRCSACGLITSSYTANFCPVCGADMKGESE